MAKADKHKAATRRDREHWKHEPDDHDYPAAHDYLSLLLGDTDAAGVVQSLEGATIGHRKAKDLLRASRLPLLGPEDPEVAKDLRRVRAGERLSPVLLVRGALGSDVPMTVADGYHRICASYHLDEDADIPCRVADPPEAGTSPADARPAGARGRKAPAGARGADGGT